MNQRNENFTMILEVLNQLKMKPNKESLSYADKFIKSNGGYKQYYDSFNQYKQQKERCPILQLNTIKPDKSGLIDLTNNEFNNQNVVKETLSEKNETQIISPTYSLECHRQNSSCSKTENETQIALNQNAVLERDVVKPNKPTLPPKPSFQSNNINNQNLNKPIQDKLPVNEIKVMSNASDSLLNAIKNFNGNFKHAVLDKESRVNKTKLPCTDKHNDIINQLFKALDDMRPYISKEKVLFVRYFLY